MPTSAPPARFHPTTQTCTRCLHSYPHTTPRQSFTYCPACQRAVDLEPTTRLRLLAAQAVCALPAVLIVGLVLWLAIATVAGPVWP